MSLILWIAMALAQEGSSEEPLAIPVDRAPAPSPAGLEPPGRPLAIPRSVSAVDANARRAYARQRLLVRPITDFSVRSATASSYGGWGWGGWGYGRYGYGWGPAWGLASVPMVTAHQSWAVFEGEHRLDVPSALEKLGEVPTKVDLERRIRRGRTAGAVWTGVGVAGLIGGLGGLVGLDQSRTFDEARVWSTVATTSTLVGLSGLVVGTFPSAKARRLQVDPSLTMARDDAEATADTHNEALRIQLGLSPEEALRMDPPTHSPQRAE